MDDGGILLPLGSAFPHKRSGLFRPATCSYRISEVAQLRQRSHVIPAVSASGAIWFGDAVTAFPGSDRGWPVHPETRMRPRSLALRAHRAASMQGSNGRSLTETSDSEISPHRPAAEDGA